MEFLPVFAMAAVGMVGFCLMLTAFVMVGFRGGWQQAMKPDDRGTWPPPRRLMLVGASLAVVFALLMFVPGVIPWWDYSSPYRTWMLGVVFGIGVGCGLTNVFWGVCIARRDRADEADRAPHIE